MEAMWLFADTTDEENALQLELYYKYLHAQAQGFDGDFEAYVTQEIAQPVIDSMIPEEEADEEVPHPVLATPRDHTIMFLVGRPVLPMFDIITWTDSVRPLAIPNACTPNGKLQQWHNYTLYLVKHENMVLSWFLSTQRGLAKHRWDYAFLDSTICMLPCKMFKAGGALAQATGCILKRHGNTFCV